MEQAPSLPMLKFGPYLVDLAAGEVRKNGYRIRLQEKPLRVLALLAERQGQVVTREELRKRLWPEDTFVDFETGLNTAVSKLRDALSDSAEKPRYIETIPRRGYRFIATLEAVPSASVPTNPPGHEAVPSPEATIVGQQEPRRLTQSIRSSALFRIASGAAILLLLFAFWWLTPLPEPRMWDTFPVTANGKQDFLVRPATDGVRIFYVQRAGDHYELMQVSVSGGEPRKMDAPFRNSLIWDVSPDGSQYLLTSFAQRGEPSPLWSWAATGAPPVKLDNLISGNATWSPNGKLLALHNGHDLVLANADGTGQRVIHSFLEEPDSPVWSPDSQSIRFTLNDTERDTHTIWQIRPDGGELRQILPDWSNRTRICCGTWTPDGRYFIFTELWERRRLWVLREKGDWWKRSPRGPFLLESQSNGAISPFVGRDGQHIYFYALGTQESLEVMDTASHQFTSLLPDIRAILPSFSRDGQWVSYVRFSTGALWVSRIDGQAPRQISTPGLAVAFPRWSPDGLTLAFAGMKQGAPAHIYTVDAQGGHLESLVSTTDALVDPDWAADGSSIIATRRRSSSQSAQSTLCVISLKSRSMEDVPDSANLSGPRWSPNGNFIAAVNQATQDLQLYDVSAKKWRSIAHGQYIGLPEWSRDGKSLYYQDLLAPGEPLFRWNLASNFAEPVTNFQKILDSGVHRCSFITLTAQGEPVIGFQRGVSDIYGASLSLP